MKAEFLKDENGNIWFFFARDIQIRTPKAKSIGYELLKNSAGNKNN